MADPVPDLGRVEVLTLEGRDGLDRLAAIVNTSSADGGGVIARVARATLGTVVVEAMESTGHRVARSAEQAAAAPRIVSIVIIRAGSVRITEERGTFVMTAPDGFAVQSDVPLEIEVAQSVQLLRASIPFDRLPPHLRDGPPLPVGALAKTLLLVSYANFLVSVIEHRDESATAQDHLSRVLQDLTVSIIAEAKGSARPRRGPDGMRYRIKEFVEDNLADPGLSPAGIAAALGVSPRYVHQVFTSESLSVSQYIRARRVGAVAREVLTFDAPPRAAELANRHGFGGPDQLVRAFRAHYGSSLEEYRTAGGRSRS